MEDDTPYVRGAQPAQTIDEAVIVDDVRRTLEAWRSATDTRDGVLIGGLALAFYSRPRFVDEIELLYANEAVIPTKVSGFRRSDESSFTDEGTGVVVHALTPTSPGLSAAIAAKVQTTAIERAEFRLASLEGLIALKLDSASRGQSSETSPEQDIINMIEWAPKFRLTDLENWPIGAAHHELLSELHAIARRIGVFV